MEAWRDSRHRVTQDDSCSSSELTHPSRVRRGVRALGSCRAFAQARGCSGNEPILLPNVVRQTARLWRGRVKREMVDWRSRIWRQWVYVRPWDGTAARWIHAHSESDCLSKMLPEVPPRHEDLQGLRYGASEGIAKASGQACTSESHWDRRTECSISRGPDLRVSAPNCGLHPL